MKYNISKELFEAVTQRADLDFYIDDILDDDYLVLVDNEIGENVGEVNINTFFFDCKEWALEQGFKIISENREYGTEYKVISSNDTIFGNHETLYSYYADSEQQACFDACEHIREDLLK